MLSQYSPKYGYLGYFIDVTVEAGLGSKPHPRTNADERAGLTNMSPYRIKNIGLFKDVMPGPFSLSAMFTDIDGDGKCCGIWDYRFTCTLQSVPTGIRRK